MIIACPACATRYVVPDSAIGVEGRTVRCAKCRHSWFQDGADPAVLEQTAPSEPEGTAAGGPAAEPAAAPASSTRPAAVPETTGADTAMTEPEAPPPPIRPATVDVAQPPRVHAEPAADDFEDAPSTFAHEPPFRPRRNILRMYTYAAVVFAVVAMGAVAAVAVYGLPDWAPLSRQTFAAAQPDLVLEFPPNRQDRRTLPNGTEFFGASGKITNVGRERRSVPPVLIVLRDAKDRIVYSWEVAPPKRQLAPGESMTINEAVTDVPRSASVAEIGWKPS